MREIDAIQKVCEDNKINMYEELNHFNFEDGVNRVFLDGFFTIKELKLLIDVFTLMETK